MARKTPKVVEEVVTDEERAMVAALLYDTLLMGVPVVSQNVRDALQALLVGLGRPLLGEYVQTV